ncbi:GNAT family N-acetyltransferase [uncultured Sunxiuqinia sp.]|uniref:GNAT family N-acetyltransferase n=1 Tax=Sunxiuqinia rutila TaxID=1397841 RepID=UPI00260FE6B7|nr:GNAT family N-acetyltransferase [uncultured Sunxiuqinia sp.]
MKILEVAWENILVGVITGGFIGIMAYLKNWYANFRIESKFPIAGRYLSKFEDEIDGNTVVVSAPAVLKQKGRKIYGETSLPDDNRKWIIDAEISAGGHIHGVYYAEDPHDKGIGNFFLFINYKKHMEGLWSGFDSINQKITSGRYSFVPALEDLQIKDVTRLELARVIEIADSELGKDYLDEGIKDQISRPNTLFRVAVSKKEGILGFCYSYILTPEELDEQFELADFPKSLKVSSKIAVLKTIAVKSIHQGKGVGSILMDDALELYKQNQIESVICVAWKSKNGVNMGGLMNLYDFNLHQEINNFWKEGSIEEGYSCPVCGNPCHCSALIYTKTL